MRNQIASIGINQSEETYLLAPKSLYKGEPLYNQNWANHLGDTDGADVLTVACCTISGAPETYFESVL